MLLSVLSKNAFELIHFLPDVILPFLKYSAGIQCISALSAAKREHKKYRD